MFKFIRESFLELKRITWPRYGEVIGNGKQVFWLVLFVSMFLGAVDYVMYLAVAHVF
ncbi:preprotein translocase subunit SecE [Borrelia sp. BU AG58]|uniref:preprotein translocase subunit SecE n=1 Tax=Borrelia sp. BU AG58 TaxID=2887345 RepID=UPI001E284D68|nr:preprotein translocase subunit SecE [Borrelia sp. BU AG58]UER67571.1 preprotein translocase subunit SecE [Borrelia sp. BU AG58]